MKRIVSAEVGGLSDGGKHDSHPALDLVIQFSLPGPWLLDIHGAEKTRRDENAKVGLRK